MKVNFIYSDLYSSKLNMLLFNILHTKIITCAKSMME